MDDITGLVVRQYTTYSYPKPVEDIQGQLDKGKFMYGDPSLFSALLWPEGRPRRDLRILVAGCGTNQAAWFAYTNPECNVIGVDLSEASLAHEAFLLQKHGLKNLRLFQGDLREVTRIGQEFDLVISTGVLHHLKDPNEGLRALTSVLAPLGAMVLMVYSASRRVGVYMLQDVFRRLGLQQGPEDIAVVRDTVEQLPPYHYFNWYSAVAPDLDYEAGIVDTLLHPQDRAYTVPEVLEFVRCSGLTFQGWLDNMLYYPVSTIRPKSLLRRRIEALSPEEQWAVVDSLNLRTGTHFFIACHPERAGRAKLEFSGDEWLSYVPVRHPFLKVLEEPRIEPAQNGRLGRVGTELPFNAAEALLIQGADGTRSIKEIIADPRLVLHSPEARTAFAQRVFKRMWELGHVFMTKPANRHVADSITGARTT
jgi:SAM-dependent methyltransferase